MKITYASGSRKMISPQLNTTNISGVIIEDFNIFTQSYATLISSSIITPSSSADVMFNVFTNAITLYSNNISTDINPVNNPYSPRYFSAIPTILTVNSSSGNTNYVSNGIASLNATYNQRIRNITFNSYETTPTDIALFASFTSGSLAAHISSSISNRITGSVTPSTSSYSIYSYADEPSKTYIRNTNLWLNRVDLSAIPAWGNFGGSFANGILIAPDTLLLANHTHPTTGSIYWFVDKNNTTITASMITCSNLAGTDVLIGYLGTSISASIIPAKIFSYNPVFSGSVMNITKNATNINSLPVVQSNQFRTLKIGTLGIASTVNTIYSPSISSSFYPWYSQIITGDSGSPYFMVVNNQLVVLGVWYTGYAYAGGPSVSCYMTQINSIMASLGSAYTLTTASIAGFPTYI